MSPQTDAATAGMHDLHCVLHFIFHELLEHCSLAGVLTVTKKY